MKKKLHTEDDTEIFLIKQLENMKKCVENLPNQSHLNEEIYSLLTNTLNELISIEAFENLNKSREFRNEYANVFAKILWGTLLHIKKEPLENLEKQSLNLMKTIQKIASHYQSVDFQQLSDQSIKLDKFIRLLRMVKKENGVTDAKQNLFQKNWNELKSLKQDLSPEIWDAWHLDDIISEQKICNLKLNHPRPTHYPLTGYQVIAVPELGSASENCIISDQSSCNIKLPVHVASKILLVQDDKNSQIGWIQTRPKQNSYALPIPGNIFKEIRLRINNPNPVSAVKFSLYSASSFSTRVPPVMSYDFDSKQKNIDIIPGSYYLCLDFSPEKLLNISHYKLNVWFELFDLSHKTILNIATYNNQMATQDQAVQYLNRCLSHIENNTFEQERNQFIAHSKGFDLFFKFFLPWYVKNCTKHKNVWQCLVQPITGQYEDKWQWHYRKSQLDALGIDTSHQFIETCQIFYAQLDRITSQKTYNQQVANNRKLYLSVLRHIKDEIDNYLIYQKLKDYAYE
jgi:hypothetical protein